MDFFFFLHRIIVHIYLMIFFKDQYLPDVTLWHNINFESQ